ncbi:hypothetical protein [Catenulispora pinisilvae]|uniref:hypothetical protein n=1 Tax=Catenulispora pinisilvae TaxID=2705253 RepID=UPI001891E54F|nr:hypothetical protein [Catenulispora pinisilvae]
MVGGSDSDGEERLTTFKALVVSHANAIAEDLERGKRYKSPSWARSRSEREDHRRTRRESSEPTVIADFDRIQTGAQLRFVSAAAAARPGALVLSDFYDREVPFKQRYGDVIATMLAARAEANGRVLLSGAEGGVIAGSLEQAGRELLSAGFPRFAEKAFGDAADIHARFKNARAEDRCEYLKLGAHRKTYPWWRPMRFIWALSRWFFGYGYKPMRLLLWIALVIAAFVVYLLHLPRDPGNTRGDAFFMAVQNFVNPMGLGDVKSISGKWESALEVETYVGDILRNIFFVLLIRRWFRL